MVSIDDQIREARAQRLHAQAAAANSNSTADENGNPGIQFGTSVAYDDAYADGTAGNGNGEFVTSLPTLDEERRMMLDDDDKDAGRMVEMRDEGRVGSHPSTLAAIKVCSINYLFYACMSVYFFFVILFNFHISLMLPSSSFFTY